MVYIYSNLLWCDGSEDSSGRSEREQCCVHLLFLLHAFQHEYFRLSKNEFTSELKKLHSTHRLSRILLLTNSFCLHVQQLSSRHTCIQYIGIPLIKHTCPFSATPPIHSGNSITPSPVHRVPYKCIQPPENKYYKICLDYK